MQAAARALATQGANNLGADPNHPGSTLPNVPDGTLTGGLVVDPRVSANPSLWSGASLPQQSVLGGQTEVTIVQNSAQAILNWSSFNVGKHTTLDFDQSLDGIAQTSWVAFNKVNDPSGIPSQILGSIQAPGQVYVINANGIIFGGSSQINVNTLVASSLPINDNLVSRGLLNNPDTQFLFSSLALSAGANGTPAFTPGTIYTPSGEPGDVVVQPGAEITTPTTADHVGGRVFLIGANVDNQGEISTPDGQTILAAGLQVGLASTGISDAGQSTSDATLRGLYAYVGAVVDPNASSAAPSAGTVINEGLIDVPRGDIMMTGAKVDQNGFLNSTTSVSLNGRIDLLAQYNAVGSANSDLPPFFPTSTGMVTLGPDSVTQILPETSSDETVTENQWEQNGLTSLINIRGLGIYLAPNSSVLAPNATVSLSAGTWNLTGSGATVVDQFVNPNGQGQVYLDSDASIDVSGSQDVNVPVSENIVAVQLNAAQLADSPLLRNGPLHGQTIYVDVRDTGTYNGGTWTGTPLADALGYIGLIQRSVGELTTGGGTVTMKAGESVIMQSGSGVDVSGGWINYQGGVVPVTSLVSAGRTYTAAQATPDRTYQNAVTISEYEQGYVQGANGGAISITAPSMALDGNLVGYTVSGTRQQQQQKLPIPSTLSLTFVAQDVIGSKVFSYSPTPPSIVFQASSDLKPADPFALDASGNPLPLRGDRTAEVILSPDLINKDGFGYFSIENSDGSITVPAQVALNTALGGSINLSAANMDIEGSLAAPGGTLQFTVYDYSPYAFAIASGQNKLDATPPVDPTRGNFTLGPTASLSVDGTISLSFNPDLTPVQANGGAISIKSFSADLAAGSSIDASGGVTTSAKGARTYGTGGSINIDVGRDPNPGLTGLFGGQLVLGCSLQAYSGSKGGSLSILGPAIQIGGETSDPNTLLFSPDFFSSGGFSSFSLTGLRGLVIAPNTVIAPEEESLTVTVDADGVATLTPFLQPQGLRTPVSLSFGASGVSDNFTSDLLAQGDLVMGDGAVIRTDPQASVTLRGQTVAVLGSIFAPAGTITVSGAMDSTSLFAGNAESQLEALPTVDLGPDSVLSAGGTTLLTPNAQGYRTGSVLPGGKITISGNIVAEAGSLLDVSGTSDVLDEAPGYLGGTPVQKSTSGLSMVPTRIDSDGGSIALTGGQELILDGTLRGSAGGSAAAGGSLTVSSGRFYPPSTVKSPLDITLEVSQQALALSPSFYPDGETAIGHPVLDINDQPVSGYGHFSADAFEAGGFDSLTLAGTVQFSGPVTLSANRTITLAARGGNGVDGGIIYADSSVNLSAPYISVGLPFQDPEEALQAEQAGTPFMDSQGHAVVFSPTYGSGNLTLTATSLIDIGALSLQHIGQANFIANGGDIRGDGTLEMAGNMTLSAGQIYPPTAVGFTIAAFDYDLNGSTQPGSVTIEASGTRQLPLSAGGTLTVYASTIDQDGVLRAPLGTIQLGWNGTGTGPGDLISGATFASTKELTLGNNSVTSVSAIDPISGQAFVIPYGIDVNGTSWIDPTGLDITDGGVAAKSIQLSSANITVKSGAQIDIRGGGDLYAYRWVSGNGGTEDILGSSSSFAIIPTYKLNYAPFAPYDPSPLSDSTVFGSDAGYVNGSLSVGDQIYLQASHGLPAGAYTLLPARYALLPGAFLITPISGIPLNTKSTLPDGSSLVSGYRFNDLDQNRVIQPLTAEFEVSPSTVVRSRAEYDDFYANATLAQAAASGGFTKTRLPVDAGQLVFSATQTMALNGKVLAEAGSGGQGGLVDISSPEDILIAGSGAPNEADVLVLDASELSSFDVGSLLIGGFRQTDATGTKVTVQTDNVTIDNSGSPLTGSDIILVAKDQLTLAPGADVEASGAMSGSAETISLGSSTAPGSGNGVALRVSADSAATISRPNSSVDSSTQPVLTIGAGAQLIGLSVTIDSTGLTTLDPSAVLRATSVSIASGQISLALTDPGNLQSVGGLILSGTALQSLQSGAQSLSLLSYSSLDTYGTGQIGDGALADLAIHAPEIRGFNQGDGIVQFVAQNILLDNSANQTAPGPVNDPSGTLALDASVIKLGANQYSIDQFAQLNLNATTGILLQGSGGLTTPGSLSMITPLITGTTAANQTIHAIGSMTVSAPTSGASPSTLSTGLGAQLTLIGASIADNGDMLLPSGALQMEATAGDVVIGNTRASQIDVGGVAKTFYDQVEYTDGGQVSLTADLGSVVLAAGSTVNVSAQARGGNAGSVTISAPNGSFTLNGTLSGNGGVDGQRGAFQLDVGTLPGSSLASLDAALDANGFTESRSIRVRNGDVLVDGLATAHTFDLSADNGAITVTGTIDASGATGGTIDLAASGSVILEQNSRLTVAGQNFDDAGKGGSISLEAGQEIDGNINRNAVVDIQAGSTIDLSVAANSTQSAAAGDFTGTLHLRAPQTADNLDLQIKPINGTIVNASQIIVEGYELFNLNRAGGATITSAIQNDVFANGTTFGGNTAAIVNRLFASNTALESIAEIRPGAEIINPSGDLILDTTWDLSTYRFGPQSVPGILTLRAAGNLDFNYNASLGQFASLSDGFDGASYSAALLPAGEESWSYRLVAGADFGSANSLQVLPLSLLGANTGSLLLGNDAQLKGPILNSTQTAQTIIPHYYQTIRTGTGDIEISAGRDIQLLSPLATIYTAGTQAAPLSDFDLPSTYYPGGTTTVIGPVEYSSPYPAQYSFRGGNVILSAQNDIVRYQVDSSGTLSEDSSLEMPTSWLYRRGYIDPTTGEFGITHTGGEVESTSWWVDFSNFFMDVGALGGGNVTLTAGHDVSNVDAVVPTNARMPKGTPNASALVELGGGDLQVLAGNDINGGVYYVERGQGTLRAGNEILTNPTRAALDERTIQTDEADNTPPDESTWLPTTLFVGNGSFDIEAGGNVLLGPVANPFLLPQGINNSFFEKSYFSTYASSDAINVSSLTGAITLKDNADPASQNTSDGSLASWYQNVLLYSGSPYSAASESQPWLRLDEIGSTLSAFATVFALMPGSLRATAFSGDLNIVGSLTLSPSPTGTLDLMAAGSINGLQPNGVDPNTQNYAWGLSQIDLSDADPSRLPSVTSPLSLVYLGPAATQSQQINAWMKPNTELIGQVFGNIDAMFDESGSDEGTFAVLQTKEALHAPGLLHADDPDPVHVYALDGDISGITLFTPKSTRVVAGDDITDIALYIQNVAASDVSVVSAGGDIIAYDPNSPLRTEAQTRNNELFSGPAAGDIQINGPGTLEVLAGRNLNLGVGTLNTGDGTGVGITSVGNARNPYLPFAGADIIAAAGIGGSAGLDQSALNFDSFITEFLDPATTSGYATRYLPDLGTLLGLPTGSDPSDIWNQFTQLSTEQQDRLALDIFYLALRDAGRDHNTASSAGYGNYNVGFAAIADLFPTTRPWQGNISLTSREIETTSGGNISLLVPGGQLFVGVDVVGVQPLDQGILTEDGGNISIFGRDSVIVGTSRIFTLRGGNIIIWSSDGDIAAGASSKTVQSAPPTRVLVDPQSGDVETDLAGLATGGGIGVLTTVAGVSPGDVDLIAPAGVIDAGDAGIRVSGNLNLAALQVLNVGNIQVQGASVGVPVLAVSLNAASLQAADANAAATATTTANVIGQAPEAAASQEDVASLISVEVLGYGGGESGDQESNDMTNSGTTN